MSDEKGLKFYLCQTPAGPQYVHLQADAKKLDPNYQTVFVDTSKQALMDRLNHLMRGPIQGINLAEGDDEVVPEPVVRVAPPPPPPNPLRSPAVQARVERTYDQIGFEEFIQSIPADEAHRLPLLADMIATRRAELADTAPPKQGKRK